MCEHRCSRGLDGGETTVRRASWLSHRARARGSYSHSIAMSTPKELRRLPVAFRVIRCKTDPAYQTENALFREMVQRLVVYLGAADNVSEPLTSCLSSVKQSNGGTRCWSMCTRPAYFAICFAAISGWIVLS